jgi:hypothetical protein
MSRSLGPSGSNTPSIRVVGGLLLIVLSTLLIVMLAAWNPDRSIPDEEPFGLIVTPRLLTFSALDQAITLQVQGLYSGRRVRPLPDSSLADLVFESDAPDVISVTSEGVATALEIGGADIQVTVGNLVARVPAIVALPTATVPAPDPSKIFPITDDGTSVVLDRVIVFTVEGYDPENIDDLAERNDALVLSRFKALGAYLLEVKANTPGTLIESIEQITQDNAVATVIPVGVQR